MDTLVVEYGRLFSLRDESLSKNDAHNLSSKLSLFGRKKSSGRCFISESATTLATRHFLLPNQCRIHYLALVESGVI